MLRGQIWSVHESDVVGISTPRKKPSRPEPSPNGCNPLPSHHRHTRSSIPRLLPFSRPMQDCTGVYVVSLDFSMGLVYPAFRVSGGIEGGRPRGELTNQQINSQKEPKPQEENAANNPTGAKEIESVRLTKLPPAVFDCVVPEITIPPVHLRPMLRGGSIAAPGKFEAERFAFTAQEWLRNLLTWLVVLPRTLRILLYYRKTSTKIRTGMARGVKDVG